MYQSRNTVFVCMLLNHDGHPIGAQVIEAMSRDLATEQAEELLGCHTALPTMAEGYELWCHGMKIAAGHAS